MFTNLKNLIKTVAMVQFQNLKALVTLRIKRRMALLAVQSMVAAPTEQHGTIVIGEVHKSFTLGGRTMTWRIHEGISLVPLSSVYMTPTLLDLVSILAVDYTSEEPYIANFNDCNRFCAKVITRIYDEFGINSIGTVYDFDTAHAYLIAWTSDRGIVLIEPQNDHVKDMGVGLFQCKNALITL